MNAIGTLRTSSRAFSQFSRLLNSKKPTDVFSTLKLASEPRQGQSIPINRPVGYDSPTTIEPYKARIFDIFSQDAKGRRQEQIDYDLKHSLPHDTNSFYHLNGKILSPPPSYFREDKSLYFPTFQCTNLNKTTHNLSAVLQGKVSILRVFSAKSGEEQINSYVSEYLDEDGYKKLQETHPNVQIVDVNVPTVNSSIFAKILVSSIRKNIPPSRRETYYVVEKNLFSASVMKTLKCENKCAGYLYLIDANGKIRWVTSGAATDAEKSCLWTAVRGLQKEATQ